MRWSRPSSPTHPKAASIHHRPYALPGTISIPDPVFRQVLEYAARSLKQHGFRDIVFIGDSGPNQDDRSHRRQAQCRMGRHKTRVHAIPGYYRSDPEGDAAIMMSVYQERADRQSRRPARHVSDDGRRSDDGAQFQDCAMDGKNGIQGDPRGSTAEIGRGSSIRIWRAPSTLFGNPSPRVERGNDDIADRKPKDKYLLGGILSRRSSARPGWAPRPRRQFPISSALARVGMDPELPRSGPMPLVNLRRPMDDPHVNGGGDPLPLVGDYSNPILKRWPRKREEGGELSEGGRINPDPSNQCAPYSPPISSRSSLACRCCRKKTIVMLYPQDDQVRRVRMNAAHPKKVTRRQWAIPSAIMKAIRWSSTRSGKDRTGHDG